MATTRFKILLAGVCLHASWLAGTRPENVTAAEPLGDRGNALLENADTRGVPLSPEEVQALLKQPAQRTAGGGLEGKIEAGFERAYQERIGAIPIFNKLHLGVAPPVQQGAKSPGEVVVETLPSPAVPAGAREISVSAYSEEELHVAGVVRLKGLLHKKVRVTGGSTVYCDGIEDGTFEVTSENGASDFTLIVGEVQEGDNITCLTSGNLRLQIPVTTPFPKRYRPAAQPEMQEIQEKNIRNVASGYQDPEQAYKKLKEGVPPVPSSVPGRDQDLCLDCNIMAESVRIQSPVIQGFIHSEKETDQKPIGGDGNGKRVTQGGTIAINAGVVRGLQVIANGENGGEGGQIWIKTWLLAGIMHAEADGAANFPGNDGGQIWISTNLMGSNGADPLKQPAHETIAAACGLHLQASGQGRRLRAVQGNAVDASRSNLNDGLGGCDGGQIALEINHDTYPRMAVWEQCFGPTAMLPAKNIHITATGSSGADGTKLDLDGNDTKGAAQKDSTIGGGNRKSGSGGDGGAGGRVILPAAYAGADLRLDAGNGGDGADGTYWKSGPAVDGGRGGNGGAGGTVNDIQKGNGGNGGDGGRGSNAHWDDLSGYREGKWAPHYRITINAGSGGAGGNADGHSCSPGKGGDAGQAPGMQKGAIVEYAAGIGDKGAKGSDGEVVDMSPPERAHTHDVPDFNYGPLIAVDGNRDGAIDFSADDDTSPSKRFVFWVNEDHDHAAMGFMDPFEQPLPGFGIPLPPANTTGAKEAPDYEVPGIGYVKDLEDFARLTINAGVKSRDGESPPVVQLSLSGTGAINLWPSVEEDGGVKYLKGDPGGAAGSGTPVRQVAKSWQKPQGLQLRAGKSHSLPSEYLPRKGEPIHLLFEGIATGDAEITVSVNGKTSKPLYLKLCHITDMYEQWSLGDNVKPGSGMQRPPLSEPKEIHSLNHRGIEWPCGSDAGNDYILLVHGWNMSVDAKASFGNTAFKRLWQLGYKGRFGVYRWPAFWIEDADTYVADLVNAVLDIYNFDASEENAWRSATGLKHLLENHMLGGGISTRVHLLAHSQGNIVAGEALRLLGPRSDAVTTYIASQAAVTASAWENSVPDEQRLVAMSAAAIALHNSPDPGKSAYNYIDDSEIPFVPAPDIMGHFPDKVSPPYFDATVMPERTLYINYFSEDDYALGMTCWGANVRPDLGDGYGYKSHTGFERNKVPLNLMSDDRYAIFSHAITYHTRPLGATPVGMLFGSKGCFKRGLDLKNVFGFTGDRFDHSGQFNRVLPLTWKYWRRVMLDCRVDESVPLGRQ